MKITSWTSYSIIQKAKQMTENAFKRSLSVVSMTMTFLMTPWTKGLFLAVIFLLIGNLFSETLSEDLLLGRLSMVKPHQTLSNM